jgi:hypothetical protein
MIVCMMAAGEKTCRYYMPFIIITVAHEHNLGNCVLDGHFKTFLPELKIELGVFHGKQKPVHTSSGIEWQQGSDAKFVTRFTHPHNLHYYSSLESEFVMRASISPPRKESNYIEIISPGEQTSSFFFFLVVSHAN